MATEARPPLSQIIHQPEAEVMLKTLKKIHRTG